MRTFRPGTGALVGVLLTATLTGTMYLADQLAGLPFVPFVLFAWVTRVLPGPVVTFGIDLMIDTFRLLGISVTDNAKLAEQVIAVLQFLILGVVVSGLFFALVGRRKISPDRTAGLVLGTLFGLPLIGITIAFSQNIGNPLVSLIGLVVIFLGWGLAESWSAAHLLLAAAQPATEEHAVERLDRRRFLIRLGASTATITVASAGLGTVLARNEQRRRAAATAEMGHTGVVADPRPFPNADAEVMPVPGTRPEYTPLKDHYKVFIRAEPTVIDGSTWTLPITGMVDNPLQLTLEELQNNYEPMHQYVTLRCISGRIPTGLISTTYWTGVSVQRILADAGVQAGARYLHITSGDGYYETVDLDLINTDERIMFCYAWDGNLLPVDHGFPLRIWIPDVYGMKQPKWITGVELSSEYIPGYWVERGWSRAAQVKMTSVIDTVAVDALIEQGDQRLVPVGGIAYSGARGISKVEVQVDGGPWEAAQLRPPLSGTTWVIWRYAWPFAAGEHTFAVRAYDGEGTLQITAESPPRPDGATGIHSEAATL